MEIEEAQRRINAILATLEFDSDALVKEIRIQDVDVTTIGSDRRKIQRTVIIRLERTPGAGWSA